MARQFHVHHDSVKRVLRQAACLASILRAHRALNCIFIHSADAEKIPDTHRKSSRQKIT
jgi:hypothetical protein